MRKRRKHEGEGHSGNERWLITYSDLITLLMIFFVVLYAMSQIDVAKFMTLSQSLNQALYPNHQIPLDNLSNTALLSSMSQDNRHDMQKLQDAQQNQDAQRLQNLFEQLKAYIQSNGLQNQVTIEDQQRGVAVTLRDVVLFDTGQAVLKSQAQTILAGMIPFLKQVPNAVLVEGFTDTQPIHTAEFPSNWELSTTRAVNVIHSLADNGVDPHRLSAVGYGEWKPIRPNDTPEDRQQNRRVNIVILRQAAMASTSTASGKPSGTPSGKPSGTPSGSSTTPSSSATR